MAADKKKIKHIAFDLVFSIAGLVLMNGVLQLVVNPSLQSWMGDEAFGKYQTILAVVAIMGTTFGVAANYSRMVRSRDKKDTNGDYNIFLTAIAVLCVAVSAGTLVFYDCFTPLHFLLLTVLMVATVLRYYGDVNYRLKLNYLGFFIYYAIITAGYCIGLLLFKFVSAEWMLVFILGETAAVIFVLFNGNIFKGKDLLKKSEHFGGTLKSVGVLSSTNMLSAIPQQADKIILSTFAGNEAVTVFYVATLLGKVVSLLTTPLNGVLIGYLTKYEGKITKKIVAVFAGVLLGLGAVALIGCYIGSEIFVKLFYPNLIEQAEPYFLIASAGQIFYFISNCLMTVILRIAGEKYQMYINSVYVVIYAVTTIPLTINFGIGGMAFALLVTNLSKYIITTVVGFAKSDK